MLKQMIILSLMCVVDVHASSERSLAIEAEQAKRNVAVKEIARQENIKTEVPLHYADCYMKCLHEVGSLILKRESCKDRCFSAKVKDWENENKKVSFS